MASLFRAPLYALRASRSVSRVPHAAQTDVTSNALRLLGKDQFFDAPGMAPTYDWPNPLRRDTRFPIENRTDIDPFETWLLKDKFFGGPGQPPSPFHQPNPRGYPFPLDGRTWTQDLYRLNGKDQFFGAPGETKTYDWPNPHGRSFPLDGLTEADATEFWLLTATAAPFAQTEWPNPSRLTWSPETRSITAQSPSWIFQPPATSDWPNPIAARFPLDNRTEADGTEFWLLVSSQAPFTPIDWPNPASKRPAIDTRTHTASAAFVKPTAQTDWPNPRLPRLAIDARTALNVRRFWFPAASATPFPAIAWPLAPRRSPRPLTWLQHFTVLILPSGPPDPHRIFVVDDGGRVMVVDVDLRTLTVDGDPRVLLVGPDTWSAQTRWHYFDPAFFDQDVFDV